MNAPTSAFDALLEALNIKELPEEDQEELLLDISDTVAENTLLLIIERMDDESADELNRLLDTEAPSEQVDAYIAEKVPDADALMEQVIREITSDLLAIA